MEMTKRLMSLPAKDTSRTVVSRLTYQEDISAPYRMHVRDVHSRGAYEITAIDIVVHYCEQEQEFVNDLAVK